jgi:hypothetical protein
MGHRVYNRAMKRLLTISCTLLAVCVLLLAVLLTRRWIDGSQSNVQIGDKHGDVGYRGDSMTNKDFPSLVETARLKTVDLCEKSKLILRKLQPNVEQLQRENTQFSPRLMALMLARSGEKLSPEDRASFEAALQYAEQFQFSLTSWMIGLRKTPPNMGTTKDAEQCAQAIEILTGHVEKLDAILAKVTASPPR